MGKWLLQPTITPVAATTTTTTKTTAAATTANTGCSLDFAAGLSQSQESCVTGARFTKKNLRTNLAKILDKVQLKEILG